MVLFSCIFFLEFSDVHLDVGRLNINFKAKSGFQNVIPPLPQELLTPIKDYEGIIPKLNVVVHIVGSRGDDETSKLFFHSNKLTPAQEMFNLSWLLVRN
jgi:hypothetical protein